MSHWFVYLIIILDSLNFFVSLIAWVFFIIVAVLLIRLLRGISEDEKIKDKVKKPIKYTTTLFFIFALIATFMPDTKQAAVIYLLPKITNSETAHEIEKVPSNFAKLLNRKMQEWLDETTGEKKAK